MLNAHRFLVASFLCVVLFVFTSHGQAIYNGGNGDGFSLNSIVQANNPLLDIYHGGNDDGFSISTFAQPDNVLYNIYNGGIEDGFALSSFAQPDNVLYDIYKGGFEDGFAFASYVQASNVLYDIYSGGNEDGFAFSTFMQASNVLYDIYQGGVEDGFAMSTFAQANNILYDIYKGGVADGFAWSRLGSIGGEVALPVTLVSFMARYQNGQVLLDWRTASEINNDYFLLERSRNGIQFLSLYKVAGAGTSTRVHNYSFADEGPYPGINYYRLKQVDFDGIFSYSSVVSVTADGSLKPAMHIFPNPADNGASAQIQLIGVDEGTPVELTITNMVGESVLSKNSTAGPNGAINLTSDVTSRISGGVYIVVARFASGQLTAKWVVK